MNKTRMKKNACSHVRLRPVAKRFYGADGPQHHGAHRASRWRRRIAIVFHREGTGQAHCGLAGFAVGGHLEQLRGRGEGSTGSFDGHIKKDPASPIG